MSYRLPKLLTLPLIALFASVLGAQAAEFRAAFRQLSAPTAEERDVAVAQIVALEGDIGALARVAFKNAGTTERCGLFEAFELRAENALIVQAVQVLAEAANPDSDSRAADAARHYMLALPEAQLKLDEAELNAGQAAAWREVQQLWLRIQIVEALVDALQKPGKFLHQFDSLRKRDGDALDRELASLIEVDPTFLEAINEGSWRRFQRGIEAERMFSNAWRKLGAAMGNFEAALPLVRAESDDVPGTGREALLAAVEVISDLRTVAVRALATSSQAQALVPLLRVWHLALVGYEPAAALSASINPDVLRTEMELTLARLGDRELLDARLATLRAEVERFNGGALNINARLANRPDISARNEAAHLMLRSGDYAGAEKEWQAVLKEAQDVERLTRDSQRAAVATFMGSVYYNLACAQALQLKLTRAGQSLETAVAKGYRDFAWMLEDGDLDALRRTERFREWFGALAPPSLVDRLPAAG